MKRGFAVFCFTINVNQKPFLDLTKSVNKHALGGEAAVKKADRIKGLVIQDK